MVKQSKISNKLFKKNLSAFRKHDLHIAALMENHQPVVALNFGEENRSLGFNKIKNFIKAPSLFETFGIPDVRTFDRYGVPFIRNLQNYVATEKIKCPPLLNDGLSFYFVIFGLGPGLDFGTLLRKFKPTILIIIEPELDNLYHSMQTDDWHDFVEWQADPDNMYFLIQHQSADLIIADIQLLIRQFCPAAFGNNPYLIYRDFDLAKEVIDLARHKDLALMHSGLGFLYDETLMMKNTYLNLTSDHSKVFSRSSEAYLSTPAIVVGAGPSLDVDIDFIRQHTHHAIIISTGTALRSLLVNGITPDFHVELENIHVYSSILKLSTEFDLSQICLLVPNTIDPHIVSFFKNTVFFYRSGVSTFVLLGKQYNHTLCAAGPLVVNVSFSLAIDIGAQDIYLIGTDFGSRGDGSDHAKDNVLYTDTAITGYVRQYDEEVPANFEGRFFASKDFIFGLKAMNVSIKTYANQCNIYNCSDGALIEGATPILSSDVVLGGSAHSKSQDLENINQGFMTLSADEFSKYWDVPLLRESINGFCDYATKIFGNPHSYSDTLYLTAFTALSRRSPRYRRLHQQTFHNGAADCVATMFRGTLDMMMISIRYYLSITGSSSEKSNLREVIAFEMEALIERMRIDALAMLDDPTDIPPAKAGGEWDNADFVHEADYTWGNVARNAECPCGSGKRFKHCHGK